MISRETLFSLFAFVAGVVAFALLIGVVIAVRRVIVKALGETETDAEARARREFLARFNEAEARRATPVTRREWGFFWLILAVAALAACLTGCRAPTAPERKRPPVVIIERPNPVDTLVVTDSVP